MYCVIGMSDYQYLPMVRRQPEGYEDITDQVFMKSLRTPDWLNEAKHLFLLPPLFSRHDRPSGYMYREPPVPRPGRENREELLGPNMIGVCKYESSCKLTMPVHHLCNCLVFHDFRMQFLI